MTERTYVQNMDAILEVKVNIYADSDSFLQIFQSAFRADCSEHIHLIEDLFTVLTPIRDYHVGTFLLELQQKIDAWSCGQAERSSDDEQEEMGQQRIGEEQ